MKKKFIAVYALIGVLALGSTALTSCVDDNESASVTAIRTAKAEQLAALAAAANAEAELYQAKALVEKANAANTEQITAENQQRFEVELEALKAQYEQKLLDWKKQIAQANANLRGEVYNNYVTAVGTLKDLESEYITAASNLAAAKVGLVSAEKYAQTQILKYEEEIAKNQAQIDAYKALGANDRDNLLKQVEELTVKISAQENTVDINENASSAKGKAFNESKYAYDGVAAVPGSTPAIEPTLETGKAIKFLNTLSYKSVLNKEEVDPEDQNVYKVEKYSLLQSKVEAQLVTLEDAVEKKTTALGKETDEAAASADESGKSAWAKYNFLKKDYEAKKKEYDDAAAVDKPTKEAAMNQAYQDMLAATEPEDGVLYKAQAELEDAEETLKKFNDAVAAFSGDAYTAYEAAIEATLKAGEEWAAAKETEDESRRELAALEGEKTAAEDLLKANKDIDLLIAECEKNIAEANAKITDAQEFTHQLKIDYYPRQWWTGYSYVDENGVTITPGMKVDADGNYDETTGTPWDGNSYVDDNGEEVTNGDYLDAKGNKVDDPADAEQIPYPWYSTESAEAYLSECEAEVANLETRIEAQKLIVAQCKSELDAVINSGSMDTPATDTPAEGEETPAA